MVSDQLNIYIYLFILFTDHDIRFIVNEVQIKRLTSVLGINIDPRLNFNKHVSR